MGPLQFDVAAHRLAVESGSPVRLDHLPYKVVRRLVDPAQRSLLDSSTSSEVFTRADGTDLAVFTSRGVLDTLGRRHPELDLDVLVAGVD